MAEVDWRDIRFNVGDIVTHANEMFSIIFIHFDRSNNRLVYHGSNKNIYLAADLEIYRRAY